SEGSQRLSRPTRQPESQRRLSNLAGTRDKYHFPLEILQDLRLWIPLSLSHQFQLSRVFLTKVEKTRLYFRPMDKFVVHTAGARPSSGGKTRGLSALTRRYAPPSPRGRGRFSGLELQLQRQTKHARVRDRRGLAADTPW